MYGHSPSITWIPWSRQKSTAAGLDEAAADVLRIAGHSNDGQTPLGEKLMGNDGASFHGRLLANDRRIAWRAV
jgi:hypothetical protein